MGVSAPTYTDAHLVLGYFCANDSPRIVKPPDKRCSNIKQDIGRRFMTFV